jgi:hypothetical protein
MAADPSQRVGDNAFHLPSFLIQNLSREDPNVENAISILDGIVLDL